MEKFPMGKSSAGILNRKMGRWHSFPKYSLIHKIEYNLKINML